jgi:pimeloyl-ACP methyl ester carboxylesterase
VPVIVFLHAFPLDSEMWRPQLAALPPGWTGLAVDAPGFGQAAGETPPGRRRLDATLDEAAEAVIARLDREGVGRAVFCGCSMGGYTALALLRRYPERVSALVLADTKMTADTEAARDGRLAMLAQLDRHGAAAVVDALLPKLLGATTIGTRPDVVAAVRAMGARASAAAIGQAVIRLMNRPDSTAALAAFPGPVLAVVGDEDVLTPPPDAQAMARVAPAGQLTVIPNAGHLSNLEHPDAFNAALGRFLVERVLAGEPRVPTPDPATLPRVAPSRVEGRVPNPSPEPRADP